MILAYLALGIALIWLCAMFPWLILVIMAWLAIGWIVDQ